MRSHNNHSERGLPCSRFFCPFSKSAADLWAKPPPALAGGHPCCCLKSGFTHVRKKNKNCPQKAGPGRPRAREPTVLVKPSACRVRHGVGQCAGILGNTTWGRALSSEVWVADSKILVPGIRHSGVSSLSWEGRLRLGSLLGSFRGKCSRIFDGSLRRASSLALFENRGSSRPKN